MEITMALVILAILAAAIFKICFAFGFDNASIDYVAIERETVANAKAKAEADERKEARADKRAEAMLLNARARYIEVEMLSNSAGSGQDIKPGCYTKANGIVG